MLPSDALAVDEKMFGPTHLTLNPQQELMIRHDIFRVLR